MEGDNPAISLFNAVEQNTLQNQEEEENIEDIRQRQQEIQNFLTAVLDEYNYDESSCDETQKSSIHAYTDNNDQLQILYEMRCKELRDLMGDRDGLRVQLEEERAVSENRRVLSENLLEQCQVSMKQLQEALVGKTEKIGEFEKIVAELHKQGEEKNREINELCKENEILRQDRDVLNEKLNKNELESITTNKLTERELQNQYLEQISLLQEQLKHCQENILILETNNSELKNKTQKTLREKTDLLQEKEKTIIELKQNLTELKTQNSFLLEEFQKTKSDFQKYVDETKAAKQAFEKIKEQIAPSRLQEIDSTVTNLKRLLQEKDDEILELSKILNITQRKSQKDAETNTELLTNPLISVKQDFKNTKSELQLILKEFQSDFVATKTKIAFIMNDLCNGMTVKDRFLLELRKSAINEIEKLRKDKTTLTTTLIKINKSLKEARIQANVLENRVKSKEFCDKPTKEFCDRATNTESENFLQKEVELRDKIAQDFQQKLKNIEDKYKNATQDKFNYSTLKQQIVELATKLHKYKTLYEDSRKGVTQFLTLSNEHIKSLEDKVLALEKGRQQTQKEMNILKLLVEDREKKVREMFLLLQQQKREMESFKKQVVLEKYKDVAGLSEKFGGISKSADILVKEVENEFQKRVNVLKNVTNKF